jgi:hypothetical protein
VNFAAWTFGVTSPPHRRSLAATLTKLRRGSAGTLPSLRAAYAPPSRRAAAAESRGSCAAATRQLRLRRSAAEAPPQSRRECGVDPSVRTMYTVAICVAIQFSCSLVALTIYAAPGPANFPDPIEHKFKGYSV